MYLYISDVNEIAKQIVSNSFEYRDSLPNDNEARQLF